MRYTKDIFDILSRGGFISQNSVSQQISNLYDAIEDDFQQYQDYFSGIGFLLEGGNGYYYFSRSENKVELADKVQRMAEWIDRIDFLKTFNTAFGSGFTFSKSNILEQFSSDIELKEKARHEQQLFACQCRGKQGLLTTYKAEVLHVLDVYDGHIGRYGK
jgi:hypothetical protein